MRSFTFSTGQHNTIPCTATATDSNLFNVDEDRLAAHLFYLYSICLFRFFLFAFFLYLSLYLYLFLYRSVACRGIRRAMVKTVPHLIVCGWFIHFGGVALTQLNSTQLSQCLP